MYGWKIMYPRTCWKHIAEQKKRIDIKVLIYLKLFTYQSIPYLFSTITIYIYIYIFTNLLSTNIHGYQEKRKKKLPRTRDKNISNHRPGEKRKNIMGQKKERKGQLRHTIWKKSRDMQSVGQKKKIKPTVKRCNATITRVLNTSGANYKINLNRESEFSY